MRDLVIVSVVGALVVIVAIYAILTGAREWEEFKAAHNCKIVSKEDGHTSLGFSSSGNSVVMGTPGKTGWLCDDGVTYFK